MQPRLRKNEKIDCCSRNGHYKKQTDPDLFAIILSVSSNYKKRGTIFFTDRWKGFATAATFSDDVGIGIRSAPDVYMNPSAKSIIANRLGVVTTGPITTSHI